MFTLFRCFVGVLATLHFLGTGVSKYVHNSILEFNSILNFACPIRPFIILVARTEKKNENKFLATVLGDC